MTKPAKRPASIGSRIEEARIHHGMSQAQLGVMLDVTRAAISQYEKDKTTPRNRVIDRLAEVFDASPEWFSHGRGERPKPADLPVAITEIDPGLITLSAVTNLRGLGCRTWSLPSSLFAGAVATTNYDHLIAFAAPNALAPIHEGDRVVVDTQRREAPDEADAVFLVYVDGRSARLSHYQRRIAASVLGRVVAFFRPI